MTTQLDQFRERVEELVVRFESLVDLDEWTTRRYPKRFRDESRNIVEIPALFLQRGPIRLLLDPIGYDVPGADGLADIYLMPAYDPQASLYYEDGRWLIHEATPADPVAEGGPWPVDAESIQRVLNAIAEHAVP